jgi:aryl-alcohol dehydrogenase-like predicted oxidoreductase
MNHAATSSSNPAPGGTLTLPGGRVVNRLGFGAMRIVGKGVWGDPADPAEVRRTLARLPDLGVTLIDTADSYGPFISEDLIREVLHTGGARPYGDVVIATKGGFTRHGPDRWEEVGRPEYLRQCVLMSLRRLGVERIDVWQLHRIDPLVPADEQFGVMREMQDEGLIDLLGLSEVTVAQIEAASQHFQVAVVQNRYNLGDRKSEAVLRHCERAGIGFIPWHPLEAGKAASRAVVDRIATAHGATAGQVALAWLLQTSPVMLPIPGTGKVKHLEENMAAADLSLSAAEVAELDALR